MKTQQKKFYPVIFFFIFIQWGCNNYVYSPSLNLSEKQLEKGAIDIKAGVGKFPKTNTMKPNTTEGGIVEIGYGVNAKVNIYGSAWTDLSKEPFFSRAGVALASRIQIWEGQKMQLISQPKVSLLKNSSKFDAIGFQIPLIYMQSFTSKMYAYTGVSYAYGNRFLNKEAGKNDYLQAAIGHIGLGYNITKSFRLVMEYNPIIQNNHYYNENQWVWSPIVISLGYNLESSLKNTKYQK